MVERYSKSRTDAAIEAYRQCLENPGSRTVLKSVFLKDEGHTNQISCESQGIDYQRVKATLSEELRKLESPETG